MPFHEAAGIHGPNGAGPPQNVRFHHNPERAPLVSAIDGCFWSVFEEFGADFGGAFGADTEAIPRYDRDQRESEDDGGNRVDFGGDAAAEASPDF